MNNLVPEMELDANIYVNITNNCDMNCKFCCMYSSPSKTTFMDFEKFQEIIDVETSPDEINSVGVQLEGGEPTMHPDFLLFLMYLVKNEKIKQITIMSNGKNIIEHKYLLPTLVNIVNWYDTNILLKISVNYETMHQVSLEDLSFLEFSIRYIKNLNLLLNGRYEHEKEKDNLEMLLKEYGLLNRTNLYQLQAYGRYSNKNELEKPVIVPKYKYWNIYACDGTPFQNDLIARSEYEKGLQ